MKPPVRADQWYKAVSGQLDKSKENHTNEQVTMTKAYIHGSLQYWEEHKPLTEYQQGVETGLKMVLKHIQFLEGIESK